MKNVLFGTVIASVMAVGLNARQVPVTGTTMVTQTCPGTAVVIKNDGTITVDKWTSLDPASISVTGPGGSFTKYSVAPNAITLGRTLDDKTKIYIESETGSRMVTLADIRKMK